MDLNNYYIIVRYKVVMFMGKDNAEFDHNVKSLYCNGNNFYSYTL